MEVNGKLFFVIKGAFAVALPVVAFLIQSHYGDQPQPLAWLFLFFPTVFMSAALALSFSKDVLKRALLEKARLDILDSMPFSVAALDENGTIVAINNSWRQFAIENSHDGFPVESIGKNYLSACDSSGQNGEVAAKAARAIRSVLSGESNQQTVEYPCHSPNIQRWFMMTVAQLSSRRGAVVSHIEITPRKIAENILKDLTSEQRLREMFEGAYDAILVTDQAGMILSVNRQLTKLFGYEPEELMGKSMEVLIPESLRGRHAGRHDAFSKNPLPRPMGVGLELYGLRKDGREIPVDISLSPIQLPGGLQISVTIRDISERKKTDEREKFLSAFNTVLAEHLSYQESLQRAADLIVEKIADVCILSTYEGGDLIFKAVAARDEAKRKILESFGRHLTPVNPNQFAFGQALSTGKPLIVENVATASGELKFDDEQRKRMTAIGVTSFVLLPMTSRGNAVGALLLCMTDSGRKFEQKDLPYFELIGARCAVAAENARLYNEAQSATKLRELILAVVAHDLLNPIGVMKMTGDLLASGEAFTANDVSRFAGGILRSVHIMNRLVADLLDINKIQSGNLKIERTSCLISKLMAAAMEPMYAKAKEKNISFKVEIAENVRSLFCDEARVVQILWNIIGNAIKFTPNDGKISVFVSRDEEFVRFDISDSGPGLEPHEVSKVFDRYWQAAKTSNSGVGLGLAIAKGLVDAHRGKIWLDSEKGKGCIFHFTIPISGPV